MFKAAAKRRTIRRFGDGKVPFELLKNCVEAARLSPSARNVQELDFVVVDEQGQVKKINEVVRFGGTVNERGRVDGEEPKAFIVIVADEQKADEAYTKINSGIAANAIVLSAFEQGLGSCIMGAIEREDIKKILSIPRSHSVQLAIALGFPKENPVVEETASEKLSYWVDENGELHIPKRKLENVLHRNRFRI